MVTISYTDTFIFITNSHSYHYYYSIYRLVFFLLYNNFIPISLYVTIELVNVGQAYFISQDLDLYDEALNMPCAVRSSNLAQELGLVSNIFSDKTGTLTRNEMKFVQFFVDEKLYDVLPDSDLLHTLLAQENFSNALDNQ